MTRHLLVIGGQRCGTTQLYEQLDAHPDVAMARPARPEPKVFMSEELAARGLDWYRRTYFGHASSQSLLGEKSTSYLEDGAAAARAVAVLGRRAAIVVQLRDPVTRAVSNWRFSTAHGVEQRPLAQALADNLVGPRDWDPTRTSVSPYAYLERGHYIDLLEPWFAAFPDTVLVRFLEETGPAGPQGADPVASLYSALGVDPTFRPPHGDRRVNASSGVAPQLDDALATQLRAHFRDSDARLAARLGRQLPWRG